MEQLRNIHWQPSENRYTLDIEGAWLQNFPKQSELEIETLG